jgi:hypothetical protein
LKEDLALFALFFLSALCYEWWIYLLICLSRLFDILVNPTPAGGGGVIDSFVFFDLVVNESFFLFGGEAGTNFTSSLYLSTVTQASGDVSQWALI